jgi:hypothetical protein
MFPAFGHGGVAAIDLPPGEALLLGWIAVLEGQPFAFFARGRRPETLGPSPGDRITGEFSLPRFWTPATRTAITLIPKEIAVQVN